MEETSQRMIETRPNLFSLTIGTGCNFRCRMCVMHQNHGIMPVTHVPAKTLTQWIRSGADAGFRRCHFHHIGEPLLHPDFQALCDAAEACGMAGEIGGTNGALLARLPVETWKNKHGFRVLVSIDGPTKELYEDMRGSGHWELLLRGMARLAEAVRSYPRLQVSVRMILTTKNAGEIRRIVPLLRSWGVTVFQLAHLRETTACRGESLFEDLARTRTVSAQVGRECAAVGINFSSKALEQSERMKTLGCVKPLAGGICTAPFHDMRVGLHGDVSPCLHLYGLELMAGNLETQTAVDLFDGRYFTRIRQAFSAGYVPFECRRCPSFQHMFHEQEGGIPQ